MRKPVEYAWKTATIILLLLTVLIVFPFLINLRFLDFSLLKNNEDEFTTTLFRTVSYGIISVFVLLLFGFCGAIMLKNTSSYSFLGRALSVLILPVMIGNISVAFAFKLIWGDTLFFSKIVSFGTNSKLLLLIVLQLWQFGLLFIYLFWMQFQTIPANYLSYAVANRFSLYQQIKDIYLPNSKNLFLLLASIVFTSSFYEESKIQYLFKSSQGTETELISNWLERNYQTTLIANPSYSQTFTFNSGLIVTLFSILSFISLLILLSVLLRFVISKLNLYSLSFAIRSKTFTLGNFWSVILLFFTVFPILLCIEKMHFAFSQSLLELNFPLLMTLFASLLSSLIAILFGIFSRLGWQKLLGRFDNKSLFFFVVLFILLLIPPLIILMSGYKWMGLVGYNSQAIIYIIWIIGHTILTLPLLGSFVLFNHFRVSNNELDYLHVYRIKSFDIVKYSFLKRFKGEYILLLIITFSFVWNEGTLNSLFSDYIPSYVSGLNMLITGRGADYTKAFGYLAVSLGIAFTATVSWMFIVERAHRLIRYDEKH